MITNSRYRTDIGNKCEDVMKIIGPGSSQMLGESRAFHMVGERKFLHKWKWSILLSEVAWLVADGTSIHMLIPFRLKSPAATIFGWWLEDSKILLKESKKCSKTSWEE